MIVPMRFPGPAKHCKPHTKSMNMILKKGMSNNYLISIYFLEVLNVPADDEGASD
jgi:hypothetical protein